jgi:exodeoxyribonuclease VII small subunit
MHENHAGTTGAFMTATLFSDHTSTPENSPSATLSFEAALLEMENIVKLLESGQCSLEQALASYDRGQWLKQFCLDKLSAARASIEQIAPDLAKDAPKSTDPS